MEEHTPEMVAKSFSWSAVRCSRSSCCCLVYSSRCLRSTSDIPSKVPDAAVPKLSAGDKPPFSDSLRTTPITAEAHCHDDDWTWLGWQLQLTHSAHVTTADACISTSCDCQLLIKQPRGMRCSELFLLYGGSCCGSSSLIAVEGVCRPDAA